MSKLRDVVVVRVSERGDREDEHFHSPEVQIEAARRWARDRGERLVASPIPEIDVSGKLPLSKRSPSPAVCCFTFLLHPAPELLERHSRLRSTHASLISEILNLLAGHAPAARRGDVAPLEEALSESELRVLRYLPTNLRSPENRVGAVRVAEYGSHAPAQCVCEARRAPPRRCGQAGARARAAVALLAGTLIQAAVSRASCGAGSLGPSLSPTAVARVR